MSKLKKSLIMLILFIFTIASMYSMSYAASVKVTDENLKSTLQKFVSSSDNDKNYKITVENNQIKMTSDEGNYTIDYDLTNKPTFTYTAEVQQGMSYKDFQEKTGGSSSTMLGYVAVANIQGVEYEDSLAYFAMCLLASAFSSMSSSNTSNSYVIFDDTELSEGVTIEKDPNDTKTIYASEFGNRVMEYVNAMYSEKQSFKDTDGLNTFEMTTEMKDKTSTSCKLVTTLTVDTDADFSQMKGYAEQMANSFTGNNDNNNNGSNTTNSNNGSNASSNNNNSNENKATTTSQSSSSSSSYSSKSSESTKDTTASKTTLPKTGTTDTVILIAVISICSILAITFGIKNRKYKDVK